MFFDGLTEIISVESAFIPLSAFFYADQPTTLPYFEISPGTSRVVFSGDRVMLFCEGFDLYNSTVSADVLGEITVFRVESLLISDDILFIAYSLLENF